MLGSQTATSGVNGPLDDGSVAAAATQTSEVSCLTFGTVPLSFTMNAALRLAGLDIVPLLSTLNTVAERPIARIGAISLSAGGAGGSSVFSTTPINAQAELRAMTPIAAGPSLTVASQGVAYGQWGNANLVPHDASTGPGQAFVTQPEIESFQISGVTTAAAGNSPPSLSTQTTSTTVRLPMIVAGDVTESLSPALAIPARPPSGQDNVANRFSISPRIVAIGSTVLATGSSMLAMGFNVFTWALSGLGTIWLIGLGLLVVALASLGGFWLLRRGSGSAR
jgi:hypothetical protein